MTQNEEPVKNEASHTLPPVGDSVHCSLDKGNMGQNLTIITHSEKHFKEHLLSLFEPQFLNLKEVQKHLLQRVVPFL